MNQPPLPTISSDMYRKLFTLIVLVALTVRVWNISHPNDQYFDEVYHGFTAQRYLHNDRLAYDIWAKPPQGKAYEWTHPPLAKLIMAGSMVLVGENSFGWRISSAIFGTGIIAMTMLIALSLFKSRPVSLLSGVILSLDGLLFVQSRIAMNDTHFLFFALLAIWTYLFWKQQRRWRWVLISAAALGLALASKWTALYVGAFLALDIGISFLRNTRVHPPKVLFALAMMYLLIPVILYITSYAQFFSMGYPWDVFVELQKQMWWYHTNLKATHPFQSQPWQWIFNLRPVWMWVGATDTLHTANIYNLGNPIFFWSGLVSIVFLIRRLMQKWHEPLWFLLIWYFCMWLPWVGSPRIMFFYHYLPALPPLAIATSIFFCSLYGHQVLPTLPLLSVSTFRAQRLRRIISLLLLLMAGWFVLFFPHLTGLTVSKQWADFWYFLLPSWR